MCAKPLSHIVTETDMLNGDPSAEGPVSPNEVTGTDVVINSCADGEEGTWQ